MTSCAKTCIVGKVIFALPPESTSIGGAGKAFHQLSECCTFDPAHSDNLRKLNEFFLRFHRTGSSDICSIFQPVIKKLKTIDSSHLQETCPAFKEGCPFVKVEEKQLITAITKCPEFKDGCPFKGTKSLAEVYEKLSHVPHAAGHESELSGQKLVEMLKKMHDTSECLEEKFGDCPVFHSDQGCPFKSVRSEEGKHLAEPVKSVGHDQVIYLYELYTSLV